MNRHSGTFLMLYCWLLVLLALALCVYGLVAGKFGILLFAIPGALFFLWCGMGFTAEGLKKGPPEWYQKGLRRLFSTKPLRRFGPPRGPEG